LKKIRLDFEDNYHTADRTISRALKSMKTPVSAIDPREKADYDSGFIKDFFDTV
jgi:hypothetical protein